MKVSHLFPTLLAAASLIVAAGCSTQPHQTLTQKIESRLAAAGFQVIPATTTTELTQLQGLAAGQLTLIHRQGKDYYIFPDHPQKQIYVGTPANYQDYQARIEIEEASDADNRAARQSVIEARNNDLPEWNNGWGSWAGNAN